jgi:hypothetical protein
MNMLVDLPQLQQRKDPQKIALKTNYVDRGTLVTLLSAAIARIVNGRKGSISDSLDQIRQMATFHQKQALDRPDTSGNCMLFIVS